MADESPNAARRTSGTSTTPVVEAAPPEVRASIPASRRWQNRKRLVLYACLLGGLGVGAFYGVQLWQYYDTHESTDDAYVVGDIVPISPRVNGTVLLVHVEEHQPVAAGQLLAQLDPRDLSIRVAQAESAVAVAAGMVARKRLEVGQVVQAGRPVLAIVPLEHVWVEANFKETQLKRMRPGQKVALQVDAYRGQAYTGTVESIGPGTGAVFSLLPPENATGNFVKVVQRVPVKIRFDPPASPQTVLRPGLSVIATVTTR